MGTRMCQTSGFSSLVLSHWDGRVLPALAVSDNMSATINIVPGKCRHRRSHIPSFHCRDSPDELRPPVKWWRLSLVACDLICSVPHSITAMCFQRDEQVQKQIAERICVAERSVLIKLIWLGGVRALNTTANGQL